MLFRSKSYNSLAAVWGLEPYLLDFNGQSYELLARADDILIERGLAKRGETIVAMAGRIPAQPGLSSMMKLHSVGEMEAAG